MLAALKGWFTGLSIAGKVGAVSALIIASGVTTSIAASCNSPTTYKDVTDTEAIPFQTANHKIMTSKLDAGKGEIKTDGVAGSKVVTYKVSYKCNKEVARQPIKTIVKSQPVDAVYYIGTRKTTTQTKPVPFAVTKQNDSSLPQGQSKVLTAGVNGVETLTYQTAQDEGQQPVTTLVSDTVTTPPVNEVDAIGTYVAAPPPSPSGCYPLTNGGNCYEPGEYCRNSDHGASGVAGDGENITCAYNNGWRWEPA